MVLAVRAQAAGPPVAVGDAIDQAVQRDLAAAVERAVVARGQGGQVEAALEDLAVVLRAEVDDAVDGDGALAARLVPGARRPAVLAAGDVCALRALGDRV